MLLVTSNAVRVVFPTSIGANEETFKHGYRTGHDPIKKVPVLLIEFAYL